jgi:uncharacterized protein (TIGR03067 family)
MVGRVPIYRDAPLTTQTFPDGAHGVTRPTRALLYVTKLPCRGTRSSAARRGPHAATWALVAATLIGSAASVFGRADLELSLLDDRSSEKGFERIFNGKDLTGWDGHPKLWFVKDGAITGQTTAENPAKHNTFLIWTNGTVGDFELRCSFKLTPNNSQGFANSGVQFRSKVVDPSYWVVNGYQADMEAGPNYTGTLYEEGSPRGTMASRGEKVVWTKECKKERAEPLGSAEELQAAIRHGDWNDYDIIAEGNHLREYVNGKQMVDVVDNCEERRAMTGVLALQLHAGPSMTVQFKNLRLKKMEATPSAIGLQDLQGTWQVLAMENNGDSAPSNEVAKAHLTLQKNTYELGNSDGALRGTFSIDVSKKPCRMEIHPEGSSEEGLLVKGIFDLENGRLRVCYGVAGGDWPADFSTTNAQRTLIVCKRKQP